MRRDDAPESPVEIDILLSTYDGETYLDAQLDSLAAQTHQAWRLQARDDGSGDDSPHTLSRFAQHSPRPVTLWGEPTGRLGTLASYSVLLDHAHAPYVMFCDQDDVWDEDKIARSLAAMRGLEQEFGPDTPLLVHSDLRVVDRDLQPIDESLWHYQGLDPDAAQRFERVLIQNVVTGCAMMANRSLVSLASPIPAAAAMHDWWLALVAAAFGRVGVIEGRTLHYRQHASNVRGARRFGLSEILDAARRPFDRARLLDNTATAGAQAGAFLERFDSRLDDRQRDTARALAGLLDQGFVERRTSIIRNGLYKVGWVRNLATLLRI
jgi:glycosyltransferase involved in cell wall biosynthesis